jgi:hypothetical protein
VSTGYVAIAEDVFLVDAGHRLEGLRGRHGEAPVAGVRDDRLPEGALRSGLRRGGVREEVVRAGAGGTPIPTEEVTVHPALMPELARQHHAELMREAALHRLTADARPAGIFGRLRRRATHRHARPVPC